MTETQITNIVKYENMDERLRRALRDASPEIRRTFCSHYNSYDSSLKTYIRILSAERDEGNL